MKGYKVFNSDWTCREFQYKVGETYEMDEKPCACRRGFHFCSTMDECFNYYAFDPRNKVAEIEAIGDLDTDDNLKYCTNKITIVRELSWEEVLRICNSGIGNSGLSNSGDYNSGDYNSGDYNSGDWNSGDYNSGDWNSGNRNSGNRNSGNRNSGYYNSGDWNSGDWNSGDWNLGSNNIGVFNTDTKKITMFDVETDITIEDWRYSDARYIMLGCPFSSSVFVWKEDMTEEEKEAHSEYKTIGGYTKTVKATTEDKQNWWDKLPDKSKNIIMSLPNFDADKFCKCVGLNHI